MARWGEGVSNPWDDVRAALATAKEADQAITHHVERMSELLNRPGNLQRVSVWELKKMKRALRDFDMVTGKWKR